MPDAMVDPKLPNSPGWWLTRLGRRLDARQPDMIRYADYYAGKHTMKFATQKFREAFGDLFREVAVNFCEVVVDKLVERLEVQGFRFSEGEAANDIAWGVWQRNGLDADFAKGIREGLTKGEFSMTVWAGPDGKPRLTVEDPINMIVSLDPSDSHTRRAALKRWYDPDLGSMFATLYLPDAIYKYESEVGDSDTYTIGGIDLLRAAREQASWKRRVIEGEPWPLPNALGVVPVVAFPNKPDLAGVGVSELKNVLPIQDAFNKNISDMLLAGEFSAFRQRYAVNVELEINPDTGKPIEPWKIAVDRLLTAPPPTDPGQPEVKFGEFSQTDLGGYIEVGEMLLKDLAVITRMPPHYLLGSSGVFPSGESLRAAETGLVRKAQDRMRDFSEPLEEVQRLVFLVLGDTAMADTEAETLWANPETRVESAHIDALTKMASLGVPQEGIWEQIPASPTQIAHWKALAAEAQKVADAAAAAVAPKPTSIRVLRDAGGNVTAVENANMPADMTGTGG